MAQTLTEIKSLLAARGLHPKHRFGQNFLHDHNQMAKIMAAADLAAGDLVLEVGPGTGALSVHLFEAGAKLVAVEIDRDLEPILRDQYQPFGEQARLYMGDILARKREINPEVVELLEQLGTDRGFKLIANLPYNVASPLLINLVMDHPQMTLAVVMVQREVGDRLAAPPGGKDYGPLSVIIQAMCEVDCVSTLSPGCFWPQPKVASAVIRMRRRAQPLTDDPHGLMEMLHRLFSRRRKQLGAILGRATVLPAGIDPNDRPESLTVSQIVQLSKAIPSG